MVEKFGFKEESQIILPQIANRMIKTPFPETCKKFFFVIIHFNIAEEVRI
jgi:hypothetical protein